MNREDSSTSSRALIHDPFKDSTRKRVEWSRERYTPVTMETPQALPPKLPESMINLMKSRQFQSPTNKTKTHVHGLSFDPAQLIRELSPRAAKNIDIEEMYEKSNPAYRTYDSSLVTRKSRLFDTPATHPTDNKLAWSSSLAGSQVTSSIARDSRSMIITGQVSPQLKESTIIAQFEQNVLVSDFQVRPQTPKSNVVNPLKKSTAQFSIYMSGNNNVTPSKPTTRILGCTDMLQTPTKHFFSFRDKTFANGSIERKPLVLRGTSLDFEKSNIIHNISSVKSRNIELDSKIVELKKKLKNGDMEMSKASLDNINKRQQEIENETHLVTEAIDFTTNERNQNAKRLQALFQMQGSNRYQITPEDSEELMQVNAQLKQKFKFKRQELKSKTDGRVDSIKQKCLKQLQTEANFVKYRYATDRKAMISDMNAYIAFLQDRISSSHQTERPSNI